MGFNFTEAQKYELEWQKNYILDTFTSEKKEWEQRRQEKNFNCFHRHFFKDHNQDFVDFIQDRSILEVGCGSFPLIKEAYGVREKMVIDPLANEYKKIQEENFGDSFFYDTKIYSQQAEIFIPELEYKIDGAIICRNAIDHAEDPLMILQVMTRYASDGCYLLFWSDIWHHDGGNEGHRSITKSKDVMDALFNGLGWRKISDAPRVRQHEVYVEYGGLFRML